MSQMFVPNPRSVLLLEAIHGVQAEIGATVAAEARWEIGCSQSLALRERIEALLAEEVTLNGLMRQASHGVRITAPATPQPAQQGRGPRRRRRRGRPWGGGQQHPVAA